MASSSLLTHHAPRHPFGHSTHLWLLDTFMASSHSNPPRHPASPGYSIPYWPPCSIPYWQIRGVRCLPVCPVPTSGFSFAGSAFRRYPLNGRIDQNETWAKGVSTCDLIVRIYILRTKNQNLGVLPLARNSNTRPVGGGADSAPPCQIFSIAQKRLQISTQNLVPSPASI